MQGCECSISSARPAKFPIRWVTNIQWAKITNSHASHPFRWTNYIHNYQIESVCSLLEETYRIGTVEAQVDEDMTTVSTRQADIQNITFRNHFNLDVQNSHQTWVQNREPNHGPEV